MIAVMKQNEKNTRIFYPYSLWLRPEFMRGTRTVVQKWSKYSGQHSTLHVYGMYMVWLKKSTDSCLTLTSNPTALCFCFSVCVCAFCHPTYTNTLEKPAESGREKERKKKMCVLQPRTYHQPTVWSPGILEWKLYIYYKMNRKKYCGNRKYESMGRIGVNGPSH